jgi:hypothetical protein
MNAVKRALSRAFCFKARRFTFTQQVRLCALYGVRSEEVVRRTLRELISAELLEFADVLAKPMLPLLSWHFCWHPGDPEPDFSALAWDLEKRWKLALEPVRIYFASQKCRQIFGGVTKGKPKTQSQLSHDLHVSGVWLRLAETSPALAKAWVHEDELESEYEDGESRPDAVLYEKGRPTCAIEFGGGYPADKLESQHLGCAERNLPYQLW